MIPLSCIERTAQELMAKAAIEIPDDYLAGLRKCADTEKGDLSAFVIKAMLENYEAAKEDRRAMCGDTGVPRWYVKIGNEASERLFAACGFKPTFVIYEKPDSN